MKTMNVLSILTALICSMSLSVKAQNYTLEVSMVNTQSINITIDFKKGEIYENNVAGQQNLICAMDTTVILKPNQQLTVQLPAYCMNAPRSSPNGDFRAPIIEVPEQEAKKFKNQQEVWNWMKRR